MEIGNNGNVEKEKLRKREIKKNWDKGKQDLGQKWSAEIEFKFKIKVSIPPSCGGSGGLWGLDSIPYL